MRATKKIVNKLRVNPMERAKHMLNKHEISATVVILGIFLLILFFKTECDPQFVIVTHLFFKFSL